jgi:hypothetical protein
MQNGSMPPVWASVVDSRLKLTDTERAQLVQGFQATFNRMPSQAPVSNRENGGTTALIVVLAVGIVLAALVLAFGGGGPVQARSAPPVSVRRM